MTPVVMIEPWSRALTHTEAEVVVTGRVEGAPVVEAGSGHMRPDTFRISYRWHTRRDPGSWTPGAAEYRGRRVTATGDPLPDHRAGADAGLRVVGDEDAPWWLAHLVALFMPSSVLVIGERGTVVDSDVQPLERHPDVGLGSVGVHDIEVRSSIKHHAQDVEIRRAPPVPAAGPDGTRRHMLPDRMSAHYAWGAFEDTDAIWSILQVLVEGGYCDAEGKRTEEVGVARAETPPGLAVAHAKAGLPNHVGLVAVPESASDLALRRFSATSAANRSMAAQVGREVHQGQWSPQSRTARDERQVAARAVDAAEALVRMMGRHADPPAAWRDEAEADARRWTLHVTTAHPRSRQIVLASADALSTVLGHGGGVAVHDQEGDEVAWFDHDRDHGQA